MKKKYLLLVLILLILTGCSESYQDIDEIYETAINETQVADEPTPYIEEIAEKATERRKYQQKIINFEPTDEIPYYWSIKIPSNFNPEYNSMYLKTAMFQDGTGYRYSSTEKTETAEIETGDHISDSLGLITIGVAFDSVYTRPGLHETHFNLYFYSDSVAENYRSPHEILESIIDKSIDTLKEYDIYPDKKVILSGFSGDGIFAQRFSVLSPEYVKIIVAGQVGGLLMMPTEFCGEDILNFPLGIADYASYNDSEYNFYEYSQIKQLIYIGSNDSLCPVILDITGGDEKSMEILVRNFGVDDPTKVYNQYIEIRDNSSSNIYFKMIDQSDITDNPHIQYPEIVMEFIKASLEDGDLSTFNTSQNDIDIMLTHEQIYREDMMHIILLERKLAGED